MQIIVRPSEFNDYPRFAVEVKGFDPDFPLLMKKIKGARWTPDIGWHIARNQDTWEALKTTFSGHHIIFEESKMTALPPKEQPKEVVTEKSENIDKKYYAPPVLLPFPLADPSHIIIRFAPIMPDRFFVSVNPLRTDWLNMLKGIEGRRWHQDIKHWSIEATTENKKTVQRIVGMTALQIDRETVLHPEPPSRELKPEKEYPKQKDYLFEKLNEKQKAAVGKLEQTLIVERKSYKTIKSYRNHFIAFLYAHPDILPSQISASQIKYYVFKRVGQDNIAKSTQSQIVSALKSFYERVVQQPEKTERLYYPKKDIVLPKLLEKEEITRLFNTIGNLKHKCLLMLLYGSGLRVGEVVRLKAQDLNFEEGTLFVAQSKGNKDRHTLLSAKTAEYLRRYVEEYQPRVWLFESPSGEHYSERSVQQVFADAMKAAGIEKRLGTHSLRHSYATHLLQSTGNLELVRKTLGHNSLETTQVYLHVAKSDLRKACSPLDDLSL
jgi:site-specific recombinase XerD